LDRPGRIFDNGALSTNPIIHGKFISMEGYQVRIHRKTKTERNPQIAAAVCSSGDDIGGWWRVLKHRGIDTDCLAARPMTQTEIEWFKTLSRMRYFTYKSWEGLIQDEFEITGDLTWCRRLYSLSRLRTPLEAIIGQALIPNDSILLAAPLEDTEEDRDFENEAVPSERDNAGNGTEALSTFPNPQTAPVVAIGIQLSLFA
jgi:hypothetical protein